MGIPKLPSVGGFNVEVSPKMSTDDKYDGTAKANTKRDRDIERVVTGTDERDIDPRTVKKEHDEKILQAAKKIQIGEGDHAAEIKSVADQRSQMIRQTLEKQLKK